MSPHSHTSSKPQFPTQDWSSFISVLEILFGSTCPLSLATLFLLRSELPVDLHGTDSLQKIGEVTKSMSTHPIPERWSQTPFKPMASAPLICHKI